MASTICIFEDDQFGRLFPLAYLRPVYDLRCGILTLREKIARTYPGAKLSLHCRTYLLDAVRERNPDLLVNEIRGENCLFINGRVIGDAALAKSVSARQKSDAVFVQGNTVIAAWLTGTRLQEFTKKLGEPLSLAHFSDLQKIEVQARTVTYPWDLVHLNGSEIERDFHVLTGKKKTRPRKPAGCFLLGKKGIFIDPTAVIQPGVVLNSEDGPIYIGKNVKILPFSSISGPVSIGDGSLIKAGSTIYGNTTIGPVCKVGGEVEGTIIHGYSNKQHAGFLGHSYVCPWVNLGAGTNNSDLKNNYSTVKVQVGEEQIDTGLQFVGLMIGDHSKSSINSMFNTGTVVGVSSNVFGSGFPPKFIPSFSWGGSESLTTYDVERAIGVARKVMERRNVELTKVEEALFRTVFQMTGNERRRLEKKNRW